MNDVIVVEDVVSEDCVRRLHVMSNRELDVETFAAYCIPGRANMHETREAGVYHLRAEWPYRGVLDIQPQEWPKFRRLVVWSLMENGLTVRISKAIMDATVEFTSLFGGIPQYAFVRHLPEGAKWGQDVYGVMLFEADWMLEQCVAVGGKW